MCPSFCWTSMRHFVLWYSIVAKKCLKVCSFICRSRGFCWVSARCLFLRSYFHLKPLRLSVPNMDSDLLGRLLSIASSFGESLNCRGCPCFSAVHFTVEFSVSRSIHLSFHTSPIRIPVSLSSCRQVAIFFPEAEIKQSISDSNGTKGRVSTGS